ncbi:gypsy retrotransposon integrase 1, partial [Chelydra serpentina]
FRAPLISLPIIEVPFECIAMDLTGPLEKTARGHQHVLVVLDYATRYLEAVPLRNTASKTIAKELVQIFARVGLPKEILTDQGTPFVSKLMKDLCSLLWRGSYSVAPLRRRGVRRYPACLVPSPIFMPLLAARPAGLNGQSPP